MVNGALHMGAHPSDFSLQRGDARVQLRDRERVQILSGQRVQRIARPTREILFGLH